MQNMFSCLRWTNELMLLMFFVGSLISVCLGDIRSDVNVLFGGDRVKFFKERRRVDLSLDQYSGSGFEFKKSFIFGKFDIEIKLVPKNSAGSVTTFYLNSTHGTSHDEIDFEFLGHLHPLRYILQTKIFTNGVGGREQRIHLWFDPTKDHHKYSILWNPQVIIFYVDDTPIRIYKRNRGVLYPNMQPMTLYATIWDGSDWATDGGKVKIDWKEAPFVASYNSHNVDGCVWAGSGTKTYCNSKSPPWWKKIWTLSADEWKKLGWVKKKFMIDDYCDKKKRPLEC
ncbi:hypothetical protein GIB67_002254 [Kingdonia uniflora]|uniref:Xyloglucan endotransglucosylase/hydrolase n=1 Tax=Kingdonia uniflora TaxID=39325 RepID=A0A7J7KWW5_9MAGN|nr:hypothetical protein GIB67_002254 [Kingdonia uniflora]